VKILLILLMPLFIFGQYSNNLNNDEGFDDAGSWSITASWTVSGSKAHTNLSTATMLYRATDLKLLSDYRVELDVSNYVTGYIRVRHSSTVFESFNGGDINSNGHYIVDFTTTSTAYDYIALYTYGAADLSIDNLTYREKLVTVYISQSGNDTNKGESATPILTPDECDTRGYYDGGAIIINSGTYAGTLDPTADVTITGNGATVAAINCGVNAVTLEGTDFTITTLTGSNIIDNRVVSSGDKSYKKYPKHPKYKGW